MLLGWLVVACSNRAELEWSGATRRKGTSSAVVGVPVRASERGALEEAKRGFIVGHDGGKDSQSTSHLGLSSQVPENLGANPPTSS